MRDARGRHVPLAAYFHFVLGADPLKLARLGRCNDVKDGGYEWPRVLHPVGCSAHEDDPVGKRRDVVLELDTAVHRDGDIVISPRMRRRRSLFLPPVQPRPTTVSTWWLCSWGPRSTGSCSS